MTRVLYFIFFASGATGLVYEVIWVRLTGLVFGNTSFSIATVLGAFMTGLALGSWRLGILADRSERPLRMYGVLEILIGVSAFLVPFAFRSMDSVYWTIAPSLAGVPGADLFVRFISSFAIMLVPTFLMGGTLPVLARFFVRRAGEVESKLATLYSLNTFGAAVGTLGAALLLIPGLGNQLTTVWVASLNLGLGLLAVRLDLGQEQDEEDGEEMPEESREVPRGIPVTRAAAVEEPAPVPNPSLDRLVLLTLMVSGFVAMVYEVAWTRALAALIGSSTYAFAIMLVTFLVGIALGSAWAARFRPMASTRVLGLFQLAIAFGGFIFLVGYLVAPYLLVALIRALYYSFPAVLTIQFLVSAALMVLATFFMGATLPIGAHLYSNRMEVLGRRIGSIYSVNTTGAILGSLVAGFFLVPVIGTERTILTGLFLNSAVALLLLAEERGRMAVARWAAVGLLLVATISMRGELFWSPGALDRGVLIYARQFEARPELRIEEHYADTDVVYFAEGNNATISVRRGNNYLGLRTNGKVDASNGNDMMTQLLMAYLPGFHHPRPEKVLIVGYGSGVTTGAATVFPKTERIDCVEIEPAVIGAAPWFEAYNRRSFDHPKVRLIEGDARNFLNVASETYDIIISEPSNPWIAGVGSLFTAEFYQLAAKSLAPDGIFAQWVQLYELSPDDVRMVLSEFQRQFPEVSVWNMGVGDLIILGSREPLRMDVELMDRLWAEDPSVRRDFREYILLEDPVGVLAHYVMEGEAVRTFAGGSRRNTDNHPLLEFHAPRNLFSQTWDLNVQLLNENKTDLMPSGLPGTFRERAYVAMMDPLLRMGQIDFAGQAVRELALLERSSDASLYLSMARLAIHSSQFASAEQSLMGAEAFAANPDAYAAYSEELWGQLMEQRGDRPAAIERYIRAAALDATRPDYLLKIAELHAFERKWDEAALWMERYIETDPHPLSSFWELLGEYLVAAGREIEAVRAFETALDLEPYSYLARIRLAEVFERRNESEKAIELLEFLTVYAIDRDSEIYTRLAALYMAEGRWDDARWVLDKGARVFPTNTAVYKSRQALEAYVNR